MTPARERPDLVEVPDLGDVQMRAGAAAHTTPRAAAPVTDAGLREALRIVRELDSPYPDVVVRSDLVMALEEALSRQAEKETA